MAAEETTARLKRDRARMTGFAFAVADALVEVDAGGLITWVDGAVRSIFRKAPAEMVGQDFCAEFAAADAAYLDMMMKKVAKGGRVRDLELRLGAWAGQTRTAVLLSIHRPTEFAEQKFYLALTQSARPAAAIDPTVLRDGLTGLVELGSFVDVAKASLIHAQENDLSPNLTLIEMRTQQELESLLGKERASGLLGELGGELRQHSLGHDGASLIGDGKYGLAHLERSDLSGLKSSFSRLCEAYEIGDDALQVEAKTVEFGAAPLSGDDISSILGFVCERFKNEGIGQIAEISATAYLTRIAEDVAERILTMRDIIREQRMQLVYQPIVRIRSNALHHYEVLLRFEDGKSPFDDIVFAESVNIIHEIDLAVAQRAMAEIDARAAADEHVTLAVNMSARSLLNETFLKMFGALSDASLSTRRQLIVEVTESTKIDDLDRAAEAVNHLRRMGHRVCLDDFGAGSVSLQYLQALDVDYVKIDGRYIRGVVDDIKQRAIVLGILRTCEELQIATVAEMVESKEQHQVLLDFGVKYGQGWYYGRPLPEIIAAKAAMAWGAVSEG
jgi:EAL domain-containing protein (putative c-di-GMP-specific phosphodiesterase class I)